MSAIYPFVVLSVWCDVGGAEVQPLFLFSGSDAHAEAPAAIKPSALHGSADTDHADLLCREPSSLLRIRRFHRNPDWIRSGPFVILLLRVGRERRASVAVGLLSPLTPATMVFHRSTKGASKARRDHINHEIRSMRALLPISQEDQERLSYLHSMAAICTYIRKSVLFQGRFPISLPVCPSQKHLSVLN